MADIIIHSLSDETEEHYRKRAEKKGVSIEVELREALETAAQHHAPRPNAQPFGTWLSHVSRPGYELAPILDEIRNTEIGFVDLS